MIRKYFLDILCIVLVVAIAILMAERPALDLPPPPSLPDQRPSFEPAEEETGKREGRVARYASPTEAIKKRNIFSASGSHTPSKRGAIASQSEGPYTLIGILQGEESKAVFRDYTGSIVALTVGKKLSDGSLITQINPTSVEVEKGKERRLIKLFDLKPPKPLIQKEP